MFGQLHIDMDPWRAVIAARIVKRAQCAHSLATFEVKGTRLRLGRRYTPAVGAQRYARDRKLVDEEAQHVRRRHADTERASHVFAEVVVFFARDESANPFVRGRHADMDRYEETLDHAEAVWRECKPGNQPRFARQREHRHAPRVI